MTYVYYIYPYLSIFPSIYFGTAVMSSSISSSTSTTKAGLASGEIYMGEIYIYWIVSISIHLSIPYMVVRLSTSAPLNGGRDIHILYLYLSIILYVYAPQSCPRPFHRRHPPRKPAWRQVRAERPRWPRSARRTPRREPRHRRPPPVSPKQQAP